MRDDLADAQEPTYATPAEAIQAQFFGLGGGPDAGDAGDAGDALGSIVEALSVVERHLSPLTAEQLAALLWIKHLGPEDYRALADDYLQLRPMAGSPEQLVRALETASLIRLTQRLGGAGRRPGPQLPPTGWRT